MSEIEYQYKRFNADNTSCTRLITLLPSKENGELALELHEVNIDDIDDTYVAVSYNWGTEPPTRRIWIGDAVLLVRENIWRFLNHYRNNLFPSAAPLLWVDSICIDQENEKEKSSQVQNMGQIFRKASFMLIWLRQLSESSLLNDLFLTYKSQGSVQRTTPQFRQAGTSVRPNLQLLCWHLFICDQLKSRSEQFLDATLELAVHEYWERLWVVQEIVLARSVAIVLQDCLLAPDVLRQAINRCQVGMVEFLHARGTHDSKGSWPDSYVPYEYFQSVWRMSQEYGPEKMMSWEDILRYTKSHKCLDV